MEFSPSLLLIDKALESFSGFIIKLRNVLIMDINVYSYAGF